MLEPTESAKRLLAQGLALVLVVLCAWAAIAAYGTMREERGANREREKAQQAAAAAFARDVESVVAASTSLTGALDALSNLEPRVVEKYKYVKAANPLPSDCRLDAGRLQHISSAVRKANAAAGIGGTVPTVP